MCIYYITGLCKPDVDAFKRRPRQLVQTLLVSEYEPSKVNFLFRPVLAAVLGGFIVLGVMGYQRSVEKQKHVEHMVFMEKSTPPPQQPEVVPLQQPRLPV
jgi:hypothetical protein